MEHPLITAQTPINQVMAYIPHAVRLLMDQHAACPGCSMSAYCTIADICQEYHLDLQKFLTDLTPP